MVEAKDKPFAGSVKQKVVLAFVLGAFSIATAITISYFSLNSMLGVVDRLTEPNCKLEMLNGLFRKITYFDQRQRLEALQAPWKPDRHLLSESDFLIKSIDTLQAMQWSGRAQREKLKDIQAILHKRDSLFITYLKYRSNAARNKYLLRQFDTIATVLTNDSLSVDSLRTTRRSTTIEFSPDSSLPKAVTPKRSFLSRLFKKRRVTYAPANLQPKTKVEVTVTVDTLVLGKRNNSLGEAAKMIAALGDDEFQRRTHLATQELALLTITDNLFTNVVKLLQEVEAEEVAWQTRNNQIAAAIMDHSIRKFFIILAIVIAVAACMLYFIVMDLARGSFYREQLLRAKERADELSSVKDRFLANMSHELRTPLQSIIGFSQQIRSQGEHHSEEIVNAIVHSSEHLLHMVEEVLDLSRIEAGKISLASDPFNLLDIVEEVALAVSVQAQTKGLCLDQSFEDAHNYRVLGDAFRFRQILYNLLGNAVKYTDNGNVRVTCATKLSGTVVHVDMEIADTGIGIEREHLEKIFDRFEQGNVEIARRYGGTGLGLTIVAELVKAFGGTIDVKSAHGAGSVFHVRLAFTLADDATTSDSITQSLVHRILIVDDDSLILKLCGMMLAKANIQFILCNNPQEIQPSSLPPDLTHVLLDIRIGSVDGYAFGGVLRGLLNPQAKLIAMTANRQVDLKLKDVFDQVLFKPFKEEQLYESLGISMTTHDFGAIDGAGDFTSIRKLAMEDEQLLKSILIEFANETQDDLKTLKQSIMTGEPEDARKAIHRLAGRASQLGFHRVGSELCHLELRIEEGTEISDLSDALKDAGEHAEAQIGHIKKYLSDH